MKQISLLIIALWCLSVALNLSPMHYFANKPNYIYSCIILVVIVSGASIVAKTKVKVTNFSRSISSSRYVSATSILCSIIIIMSSLYIAVEMLNRGELSLSANREIFESKYYYFNYIFILTIPFIIMNSLSKFSSKNSRLISALAWMVSSALLLLSGNRQFFFFTLSFLCIYHLGISKSPKLLLKKILLIGSLVFAFLVVFSIFRLDYLGSTESNIVAKYMSTLTGSSCTADDYYCDSFVETIFQFSYAYLGMNHSGLTYSLDFYYQHTGLPALLSTFPIVYRRFETVFLLDSYTPEQSFKNFISAQAGGEYSNFFSTMFGAFGIEFGWHGVIIYSGILLFATWYLSKKCSSKTVTEVEYNLFSLILTAYVFGIMQSPTTEPFYFLLIVFWTLFVLINAALKK